MRVGTKSAHHLGPPPLYDNSRTTTALRQHKTRGAIDTDLYDEAADSYGFVRPRRFSDSYPVQSVHHIFWTIACKKETNLETI
jgi:hypothetical protein